MGSRDNFSQLSGLLYTKRDFFEENGSILADKYSMNLFDPSDHFTKADWQLIGDFLKKTGVLDISMETITLHGACISRFRMIKK